MKVAVLCILPVFFGWEAMNAYYAQESDRVKMTCEEVMESKIVPLIKFFEDRKFWHALLKNNFYIADKSRLPIEKAERVMNSLKKYFPGRFEFVFWNKHGKIIPELADIKGFRYVLQIVIQAMYSLKNSVEAEHKIVKISPKTESLLKGFIGQFFWVKRAADLFKDGDKGNTLTVSEKTSRRHFWFYSGENFSTACFIDDRIYQKNFPLRLLIRKENSDNDQYKTAYISPTGLRFAGLPENTHEQTELLLEARKYEEFSTGMRETRNFLAILRKVSPDLIIMSYIAKPEQIKKQSEMALRLFFKIFGWALVIIFFFYVFGLRSQHVFFVGIQAKLILFFLLANGVPALMVVSTSYNYFAEKRIIREFEKHRESVEILREIDRRYSVTTERLERELNRYIDEKNQFSGEKEWAEKDIRRLDEFLREKAPDGIILIDVSGKIRLFSDVNHERRGNQLVNTFFHESLKFFNSHGNFMHGLEPPNHLAKIVNSDDSADFIYWNLYLQLDRITRQIFGFAESFVYFKLLGNQKEFKSWGFLTVAWNYKEYFNAFMGKEFPEFAAKARPRIIGAMDIETQKIFGDYEAESEILIEILKEAELHGSALKTGFLIENERFILSAIKGTKINAAVLFSLYPVALLEEDIFKTKLMIGALSFLVALILIKIAIDNARSMLNPIRSLSFGLNELKNKNYSCHIDLQVKNEIGQLVGAFNSTIESLKDLEVGTAVQTSLLPEPFFESGRLKIYARSLFMSKMGGDYFDVFRNNNGSLFVFFGDVAGHGIPAALIMAMAKASILACSDAARDPQDILNGVNMIFPYLKERKYRTMMTALCLEINPEKEEISLANSGQCFPILLRSQARDTVILNLIGLPLGSRMNKSHKTRCERLMPGDTLILYSDGIIEAKNAQGEMFALERFIELLKCSWSEDLEEYWRRIIKGYRAWCEFQDDDVSMVLIRYE